MTFDKPKVRIEDLPEILSPYDLGDIVQAKSMGGVPNTTFKVMTSKRVVAVRIYSIGQSSLKHILIEHQILKQLTDQGFITTTPVTGRNHKLLQYWGKYPLLVTEYIDGEMAEDKPLTKELSYNIGALLNKFRSHMKDVVTDPIPGEEYLITKGSQVL